MINSRQNTTRTGRGLQGDINMKKMKKRSGKRHSKELFTRKHKHQNMYDLIWMSQTN